MPLAAVIFRVILMHVKWIIYLRDMHFRRIYWMRLCASCMHVDKKVVL